MPERRSQGEGSKPRQRKDGRWEIKVSLGANANGKRARRSVYGATKRECQQAAKQLIRDYEDGKLADPSSLTIGEYLEEWLEHKRFEVEPRTHDNYQRDAKRYLQPKLAKEYLQKLTTGKVKAFQLELAKAHGSYTANRAKSLLSNLLNDAVQEGLLVVNVADRVKLLKHEKKRIEIWTAEEIPKVLEAARETRWYGLIYLALMTGMRHGELTGLRRAKVTFYPDSQLRPDEDHGEIRIDTAVVTLGGKRILSTPKTPYSIRSVGFSRETKEVLLEHYEMLELENQKTDLVFPTSTGNILDGTNTLASLARIIDRANPLLQEWLRERTRELTATGLSFAAAKRQAQEMLDAQPELRSRLEEVKYITFHDLRHTFASMMIASGMDVVKLSRMLGHRDPGFTLKTYAHFFERQNRPAMPSLSSLLGSAGDISRDTTQSEDKDAA
jgi:integrase